MLDFGEILLIGAVALVVLGPERLPQAARTLGQWIGKLQNYVSQMRVEFDREFHLADLRRLGEEARASARSVETAVRSAATGVESEITKVATDAMAPLGDNSWSSGGPPPPPMSFARRYRPRPSIDDLTQEIERLKRQLALPDGAARSRQKFAPRARINRPRVRR
ncbi:putative Sec-independent protein translocase protein TatB [Burkholderiales bacterium]|jgi:sec-independent protein translocase protein TatB|nr:putative Sec-independent protein translocase protein TatB [Burkholderiales bacterium]